MDLLSGLLELIAPTRCAGCELPGSLLCERCTLRAASIEPRYACPRCGAPFGFLVCTECWNDELAFCGGIALGELEGPLARAVVLHKDAGERRLGEVLGVLLAYAGAPRLPELDLVTWIPPTRAALRRRGFDHGLSIAQPCAAALGVVCEPTLVRATAADQRRLGRLERQRRSAGTFSAGEVRGRVLVVDDVMTTGATLDAAASALLEAGADEVWVAVVARAW